MTSPARLEASRAAIKLAQRASVAAKKADHQSRMAWASRWRRTHWHVDWKAIVHAEGGLADQPTERADGMAFAKAWREQHQGVDWAAVVEAEAIDAGRLAA